jgi:lipoprotein-anchoring transpeptidase ErfK/SrfK
MLINRLIAPLTAATVAVLTLGQAAHADLLIKVDKSAQRMTVTVDGNQLYDWPVSTGGRGYDTPSGTFKPFRMDIDHYSEEWDNAPMPYSIFFTKTGDAVHGTYEQRNLGHAVSHGCVRLSVKNAATLWKLVTREKMASTTVVLSGATWPRDHF